MKKIETVTKKLDLIESAWRNYIWDSNYLKSKINFTNELKTNYVGSILGNFHDTLPLLKKIKIMN